MKKFCVVCVHYKDVIQNPTILFGSGLDSYADWCFDCAEHSIAFKQRIHAKLRGC